MLPIWNAFVLARIIDDSLSLSLSQIAAYLNRMFKWCKLKKKKTFNLKLRYSLFQNPVISAEHSFSNQKCVSSLEIKVLFFI